MNLLPEEANIMRRFDQDAVNNQSNAEEKIGMREDASQIQGAYIAASTHLGR